MVVPTAAHLPAKPDVRSSRHGRRRNWDRTDRIGVALIMVVAALGVAFADATPTGVHAVDVLYRLAIGAFFPLVTSRARRWSWLASGVIATVCCPLPESLLGLAALAGALAAVTNPRRSPWLGALVGAFTVQSLFRMTWPAQFGTTAVIGVLVALVLTGSAYRTVRRSARRNIRRVVLAVGVLVVAVSAVTAVTVLSVRSELERGVKAASRGLAATQDGRQSDARRLLGEAESDFGDAADALDGWWMQPSRILPVISQHLDAAITLSSDGRDLAASARTVASAVDLDRLRNAHGDVDLELLSEFRSPLERSSVAVANALDHVDAVRSPWLVNTIADKLSEFADKLTVLAPGIRNTADAAKFLPSLLGEEGERRYFLMLLTPSESRDLGGHMGNWAEMTASKGRLDVTRSGRTALLRPEGVAGRTLHDPTSYPVAYLAARPAIFPQNWGASPDLPTVARAIADLYPQSGGSKIDGVAVVDPYGFASLLRITGPYRSPGAPTLDTDNAADFLLRRQYTVFADETARADFLDGLVTTTIRRLRTGGRTSPRDLIDALAAPVRGSQLRFTTFHPDEAAFLERVGLARTVRRPERGDQLAVISTNLGPNKMDAYMTRNVTVAVTVDPDSGILHQQVAVTLANTGPISGPRDVVGNVSGLPNGTAIDRLSVLTPLRLVSVSVDGKPAAAGPSPEFGLNRYGVPVVTRSGATTTVTFELAGTGSAQDYRLALLRQPLASSDRVTVSVSSKDGTPWRGGLDRSTRARSGSITMDLDADAHFEFSAP